MTSTSDSTAPTTSLEQIGNLAQLFRWRVASTPDGLAYQDFDSAAGRWRQTSWRDIGARVDAWRQGYADLHLPFGSRVAILLPNGLAAVCADQGALAAGLVPVPMHALDNPESIAYILNDSDTLVLVVSTLAEWRLIRSGAETIPALRHVIVVDEGDLPAAMPDAMPALRPLSDWLPATAQPWTPSDPGAADLAAIVYTSGTTGRPKGVMLTHGNVMANLQAVMKHVPAGRDDVFLSFLPLSHTFERTAGYYLAVAAGASVAYARSVSTIADDLKTIRPTILVSVPRIYERFYAKLNEVLAGAGPLKRAMFDLTRAVGWRRFCRRQGMPVPAGGAALSDALLWPLLDVLVARAIRALFGGRLRAAVSGGAPLSGAVAQCFIGMGVPVLQGYGMTETSPVVAANRVDDNWPHTIGRALAGVETRIAANAELQVRGPSVMKGYWKRPEDTARAFTDDGWLHTGDQAGIEDGRLRILGRIKEIIVTSTGEKVAPADLELAICADPLFDQAFVFGEGQPFLIAFVVLNAEQWRQLAAAPQSGLTVTDLNNAAAHALLLGRIKTATRSFPYYAVPRALRASLDPWTVQNSLMTPTLKLKRINLQHHFQADIDSVYADRHKAAT